MIKIAICDDELVFRNQIEGLIGKYFEGRTKNYSVNSYSDGDVLLKQDLNNIDFFF